MRLSSSAHDLLRQPGFAPALRLDVKFYRGTSPAVVIAVDPTTGRRHQLYEIECMVAQEMDGTRDLAQVTERAKLYLSSVNRAQIEKLVLQFAALGLLANVPMEPLRDSVKPNPVAGTGIDFVTFREQLLHDLGVEDQPAATAEQRPDLRIVRVEDDEPPTVVGAPMPFELPPEPTVQVSPDAIPDPIPEPEVEPEGMPAPSAEAMPEPSPAEEGEQWRSEKPPWHQRAFARRLAILFIFALAIGLLYLIPYARYVTEECTLLPSARVEVRSEVEGIISAIQVDEGDHVKKGDLLARLDDRDITSSLNQARAEVDRLTANLAKLRGGSRKEEIARAVAVVEARSRDVKYAKIEADRRRSLYSQGVGSAEQRDNAARDYELKRTALSQAEAELKLMRSGFRSEEVEIAEAELRRAQVQLQFFDKKQHLFTITSPIDGQVMTPKFRERMHAKVAAGDTICEVANSEKMHAEIFVPERDIDIVVLGQPTVVKVQSYPLHPFVGKVTFISSIIEERPEGRYLRVVTEIENPEGLLHERMTGYGEIDTGKTNLLSLMLRRVVRWARVRLLI